MTYAQQVTWTRNHLNQLKVGGYWSVPRSGLVFQRTGEQEVTLIARHKIGAYATKLELERFQQEDADCIAKRIVAAGFTFKDNTKPKN